MHYATKTMSYEKIGLQHIHLSVRRFYRFVFYRPGDPDMVCNTSKAIFMTPKLGICPVWTTLFIMMGISLFLVWQKGHSVDRNISDDKEFYEDIKNSSLFAHTLHSMGKLCSFC